MSRKISETYADGSVLQTAYCGPSTLVTDPVGKWRRSRADGLGRLVEVDEPNAIGATVAATGCPGTGEPTFVTSYTNDTLGNLTGVIQNGSHQRTFTYDSLSRLLTSNNPETGTITYTYSPDSTLLTKTDARAIVTTSTYDALHREKTRTYSNGDPSVTVNYDESNCLGLPACQNIGQRTSMTDAAGSEAWAFQVDKANSRSMHVNQRTITSTPSNVGKTTTYTLDLAGNTTSIVYPTGRIIDYIYDSADRPSVSYDSNEAVVYALGTCSTNYSVWKGVCYTPQGTPSSLTLGTTGFWAGLNASYTYNNRLQPLEFKASSTWGMAIDITYSFVDSVTTKNAGHVTSIANNLNSSRTQNFTYDQLNRISSAGTLATTGQYCWGYQYSYDAWANLLSQSGWTPNYNGCTQTNLAPITADANNHISGLTYDASGNTLTDGQNTYVWDGESQLKSAAAVNYLYDGDGRRVSKVGKKLYWYGSGGEILSETDSAGNTLNEFIYFGGKRVADQDPQVATTEYVEDMLGSSRVVTDFMGVCYDADFTPFGGERAYIDNCSANYKFEGKERDTETGNDDFGARYYSNRLGRWLSSDWSAVPVAVPYANLTNPQTLNLYSMVADDPESFADLDGHAIYPEEHYSDSEFDGANVGESAAQQQNQQARASQPQKKHHRKPKRKPPNRKPGSKPARIVFNETSGLRPGSDNPEALHDARVGLAHTLLNAAGMRHPPSTVGDTLTTSAARAISRDPDAITAWGDSQSAVAEAGASADDTGGAIHFFLDYEGATRPAWATEDRETANYGPFTNVAGGGDVPQGATVTIRIYTAQPQY